MRSPTPPCEPITEESSRGKRSGDNPPRPGRSKRPKHNPVVVFCNLLYTPRSLLSFVSPPYFRSVISTMLFAKGSHSAIPRLLHSRIRIPTRGTPITTDGKTILIFLNINVTSITIYSQRNFDVKDVGQQVELVSPLLHQDNKGERVIADLVQQLKPAPGDARSSTLSVLEDGACRLPSFANCKKFTRPSTHSLLSDDIRLEVDV